MPPAVAEAAQMRRAVAAVGAEDRRYLADFLLVQGSLDHHFTGEFHAGRAQVEALVGVLAKAAQAAVGVADGRAEEEVEDAAEHRVADIFVVPGHGAGLDAAFEAIAHHQVVTAAQTQDERLEAVKS